MKKIAGWILVTLVGLTGCNGGTTGGPGATNKDRNKIDQPENTFRLDPPNLPTTIRQGETRAVDIGIDRGRNFDQDVTLKFTDLPRGVTIDPQAPVIKNGEREVRINVRATADAAPGTHTIKITGSPKRGADATNDFKITVEQK
jgi:uncharacterized membrane protein